MPTTKPSKRLWPKHRKSWAVKRSPKHWPHPKKNRKAEKAVKALPANPKTSRNIKAPGGVKIDAPNVGCTAQITAEGQINGNGGMAVKVGRGTSFTGNVKMVGDLDTTGKLTNNGKSVGSDHKHTGDSGGTTSDPL